jgi:hypothetical protein
MTATLFENARILDGTADHAVEGQAIIKAFPRQHFDASDMAWR